MAKRLFHFLTASGFLLVSLFTQAAQARTANLSSPTGKAILAYRGDDGGHGIAVDGSGNVYVTGWSNITWGSPVRAFSGQVGAFVAKLNSSGALVWNTFLGGSGQSGGYNIAVDGSGNVYVVGYSTATWGSPVRAQAGGSDVFAAKLTPSGALTWNTFLGSSANDYGYGIAVDGSGNVYLAGYSYAAWGSPVRAYTGDYDAFAAKLDSSGTLTWHTFLGGSGTDYGFGVAVDGSANVLVGGTSFATWGGPVRAYSAGGDGFAAKLTSSGVLTWNTFLGGSGADDGSGIAVDGSGIIYVVGGSDATWGSPVRTYTGDYDAYAAKLTSSGVLTWNTFLGGSGSDYGIGIAVDGSGSVYTAGFSRAGWSSPVRAYSGDADAFAAKLNSSGMLTWNTFLGGTGEDLGYGFALGGSGEVRITGMSNATWGSPVHAYSYYRDAYAAKLTSSGALSWNTFMGASAEYSCLLHGLPLFDFNVDCKTDVAVYRPSTGAWYIRDEPSVYYGAAGDLPRPGDYNGDGQTDIAVYRPSTGAWYIRGQHSAYYGAAGDLPVPGDYNADGVTEIAVYRPSTGAWYIKGQSTVYYGASTDIPVPGDYDGNGTTDIAVYRPSNGAWYIRNQYSTYYGVSTDIPVPGDYDGDGMTDIAVYRPSTGAWYIRGQYSAFYGVSTDIPIPGDYDADGTTDIAVFRPSTGAWYIRGQFSVYYGASGDIPLPEMGTGMAYPAP
jgi:hypothetical protein